MIATGILQGSTTTIRTLLRCPSARSSSPMLRMATANSGTPTAAAIGRDQPLTTGSTPAAPAMCERSRSPGTPSTKAADSPRTSSSSAISLRAAATFTGRCPTTIPGNSSAPVLPTRSTTTSPTPATAPVRRRFPTSNRPASPATKRQPSGTTPSIRSIGRQAEPPLKTRRSPFASAADISISTAYSFVPTCSTPPADRPPARSTQRCPLTRTLPRTVRPTTYGRSA